jgi:hypothetical protein
VWFVVLMMVVVAAAALPLGADTRQPSLIFQSTHQSIWGPGASAAPSHTRYTLVDPNTVRWNVQTSGYAGYQGRFFSQDTYVAGTADFGAGFRGRVSGHAGLWFDLNIGDPGSVNVTYPVTPKVVFPDANSFRAGDTVAIKTSYVLDDHWEMTTVSPQFSTGLDAAFALHADARTRLCVFNCAERDVLPTVDFDTGTFNVFTVRQGSDVSTPPFLDLPVSAAIHVPNISTTASLDGNGRSLAGAGSDRFISVSLDLADLGSKAAEAVGVPVPPLSFNTDDYPGGTSGIHFDYNIVSANAVTELTAHQNFRFDPNLKVHFAFAQPLEHWIVSGGVIGVTETSRSADVHVGDTLYVKYPEADKQPTEVAQTFRLDNQFHSATGVALVEHIDVSAGALGVGLPSIEVIPELCTPEVSIAGHTIVPEICTPSVSTPSVNVHAGPLFDETYPIAARELGDVFSAEWQLGGFTPVAVDAFKLDPENPIIEVDQTTGAVRNLGSGHRQIAYAIDIRNGGDVTLDNVHLITDLAAAFGASNGFTVDRVLGCDVNVNPSFNGASVTELLAPGSVLNVGAAARVIVVVSVYPKPDPAPYVSTATDDGTSPLGTFVTKSDSSDVLLGPGIVQSADDFVLYGDQFVKLDSIGNTSGHIGANEMIEVKNGTSGVVAGDLRARRSIKVQGSIAADYAFSGGVIDVVRPATLTLSGNAKPFANVQPFVVSAPAFVPQAPFSGNIWVAAGATRSLQPGSYGDVTVNAGALLDLAGGTYHFLSLVIADRGRVAFRSGEIYVRGQLTLGANSELSVRGSSRLGTIYAVDPGELQIGAGASVHGVLVAPRANVTFGERSRLEGSAYGRSITLRPGASASYHFDCDRLVDRDCDGSPDCARR